MSVIVSLKPGGIALIGPAFVNPALAGCLLIVEEVKGWGVLGYVICPGETRESAPRHVYVRVAWADLVETGGAIPPAALS